MKEIRNLPRAKVLHHFFDGREISDRRRFQKADQKNEDMSDLSRLSRYDEESTGVQELTRGCCSRIVMAKSCLSRKE
jgi:hypothetical protein